MQKTIGVTIKTLSPVSFGAGTANVTIDSDVVYDAVGLPYLPAKRLRGLLYESAVEVAEIMESCDLSIITHETVESLFNRSAVDKPRLGIYDFQLQGAEEIREALQWAEQVIPDCVQPIDVLKQYTDVRYQTAIDENGIALDTSLRNMRVLDKGQTFVGNLYIDEWTEADTQVLVFALQNLTRVGMKRNRGFGHIQCSIDGIHMKSFVQSAFAKVVK